MIIQSIKKQIYQILSENLNYNVNDNSFDNTNSFPVVRVKLSSCKRDRYKKVFVNKIKFKIDIYSEYNGEKEILEMEENIFNQMKKLYDIPGMIYIQESGFHILDDKSAGYVLKHGIISYTFYTGGEEIEEEGDDEQTDPTP